MKSIYILLTRSTTIVSFFVRVITGAQFTHVSIAFERDLTPLYSSSRKNGETLFPAGPCREYIDRGVLGRMPTIPCRLYRLTVDDRLYWRARPGAEELMANEQNLHFNIIGLVLCSFRIPLRRNHHYFCSQLVSEVLHRSEALRFSKDCTLVRPMDFTRMSQLQCLYDGQLGDINANAVLSNADDA